MKEINCTFQMGGTYYLEEKSVYAARLKAQTNLPLPEDRDYIDDSLTIPDLDECMVANGWEQDEVKALSRLSSEALIKMIDGRVRNGFETLLHNPYSTTRLKEFLLDYYGIDYDESKPKPEKTDPIAKECYIVIQSCYSSNPDACAFETREGAIRSINHDLAVMQQTIADEGLESRVSIGDDGRTRIYVPDTDIYYEWQLIPSSLTYGTNLPPLECPVSAVGMAVAEAPSNCREKETYLDQGTPYDKKQVQQVTLEFLEKVIKNRLPLGLFLAKEGDKWVAVDNATSDAWTEEFPSRCNAIRWLTGDTEACADNTVGQQVPSAMSVHTPLGDIIVRTDPLAACGVFVDLRRPDSDQDMSLVSLCFLQNEDDGNKGYLEAVIDGEGKKDQLSERTVFDGVEDFFRLT